MRVGSEVRAALSADGDVARHATAICTLITLPGAASVTAAAVAATRCVQAMLVVEGLRKEKRKGERGIRIVAH